MGKFSTPVLLIHGEKDALVTATGAQLLAEKAETEDKTLKVCSPLSSYYPRGCAPQKVVQYLYTMPCKPMMTSRFIQSNQILKTWIKGVFDLDMF